MHSVDKAGGKDGRLCSQIIFWASVGAMTENNIQPPRGRFPCGKKLCAGKLSHSHPLRIDFTLPAQRTSHIQSIIAGKKLLIMCKWVYTTWETQQWN